MRKRAMHTIHKWISASVGLFLLVWLISGIVMILPSLSPSPAQQHPVAPVDFREITMSPADAVLSLEKVLGKSVHVTWITLKRIQEKMVYEVSIKNGGLQLIDVRSGQIFLITPELSEQIVRDKFPTQARILKIERVDHHDFSYRWGPLPAYRVVFDDNPATLYHVSINDGKVQRSDRLNRVRGAIQSLHAFEPLKLITKRGKVRKGLLFLLSVIGIGAVGTGYYLIIQGQRP